MLPHCSSFQSLFGLIMFVYFVLFKWDEIMCYQALMISEVSAFSFCLTHYQRHYIMPDPLHNANPLQELNYRLYKLSEHINWWSISPPLHNLQIGVWDISPPVVGTGNKMQIAAVIISSPIGLYSGCRISDLCYWSLWPSNSRMSTADTHNGNKWSLFLFVHDNENWWT